MIARMWVGQTPPELRDDYVDYVERTGLSEYRATAGNQGAYLLVRDLEDRSEFTCLSFWESWESIRAFAGEEPERARYYPEDRRYLLAFPRTVQHFDVHIPARGGDMGTPQE